MAATTMATADEVKILLLEAFPGADVSGVTADDHHHITGVVRWSGCQGWPPETRWDRIAKQIRDPLGARGLNVGVLHLLTPKERLDG